MCKTLVAIALLATGVVGQTLKDEGKALRGGGRNTLFGGHSDEGGCYADASEGSAIIESCDEFNLESSDGVFQCYCRTAGPSN